MKIPYARFIVEISAEKDDINGPDELDLSDAVAEIEEAIIEMVADGYPYLEVDVKSV
jgi:hypothetical protein